MFAFDPGKNRAYVPLFAVEGEAPLRIVPDKPREAAVNRADRQGSGRRQRWGGACRCGKIGQVEANHLGGGGQGLGSFAPTPAREVFPVGGIGLVGVVRGRGPGIVTRRIDQPVKIAGARHMGGQGDRIAVRGVCLVALSVICRVRGPGGRFPGLRGLIFRGSAHVSQPIPLMSDKANLLDTLDDFKVRRFLHYNVDESAVVSLISCLPMVTSKLYRRKIAILYGE